MLNKLKKKARKASAYVRGGSSSSFTPTPSPGDCKRVRRDEAEGPAEGPAAALSYTPVHVEVVDLRRHGSDGSGAPRDSVASSGSGRWSGALTRSGASDASDSNRTSRSSDTFEISNWSHSPRKGGTLPRNSGTSPETDENEIVRSRRSNTNITNTSRGESTFVCPNCSPLDGTVGREAHASKGQLAI